MTDYPWYALVNHQEPVAQGDFFLDCPIVLPPPDLSEGSVPDIGIELYNVVVMSQSCDLAWGKISLVLVCPVWGLAEFGEMEEFYRSRDGKESLRRGNMPGYHLLNACDLEGVEELGGDYFVVDFRSVFSVHFDFLREFANRQSPRLRLLPPYREHLSQAFARFFMRVGLPVDIPAFK